MRVSSAEMLANVSDHQLAYARKKVQLFTSAVGYLDDLHVPIIRTHIQS